MKEMKKKLFVSIVICTYNRAEQLDCCIKSLLIQDYPRNRYEIIVVDDGSTDNTSEITSKYPVKLIKHKSNMGISASRNSGLKQAKGRVYVCFDDDCLAKRNWLSNLILVYRMKNIAGVGSFSILPPKPGIIDIFVNGYYMTPAPLSYGISKNPVIRFATYLKNMFFSDKNHKQNIFEVFEIYGFNSSFPTSLLRKINGWDESMEASEDVDICQRIRSKYRHKRFYITTNAKLIHDHRLSLLSFLLKPYRRGKDNLKYYLMNNIFPPIFPFPVIYIVSSIIIIPFKPILSIIFLLFLPQILYFWWLKKFISTFKSIYFLFPYIQLSYEFMVITGILRGYILLAKKNYENKS